MCGLWMPTLPAGAETATDSREREREDSTVDCGSRRMENDKATPEERRSDDWRCLTEQAGAITIE